jgi:hypothetical protein
MKSIKTVISFKKWGKSIEHQVETLNISTLISTICVAVLSEVDEEWRSARSSVYETQEVTIRWVRDSPTEEQPPELIRPASKVWKRAMAPEVHADLVRALKARESQVESLDALQQVEVKRTHTILITDADMTG